MPLLQLRLARPFEAPHIAALSRDRIERGLGWRWTPARVVRSLADPATNVVVARREGDPRLLGFGIMRYLEDEAHLLLLAVREDAVRLGVGSALMDWLECTARVAGIGQVQLESRQRNGGARAFYARLGYQEIQKIAGYYEGREAAVRLAKDLWLASVARD